MGALKITSTKPKIESFTTFSGGTPSLGFKFTIEAKDQYKTWVEENDVVVDGIDISSDGQTITVSYHDYYAD